RPWIFAFTALAGATLVLLPLGGILVQSGSAAAWVEALQRAGDSLLRSIIYAVLGGALLSILGFFTAYLIHTKALPFWRGLDSLTLFVFAIPSTVIGIGLISLWNTPWTMFIYATPLIIIVGYLAKYTVLTSRITLVRLSQLPPSMEEAAQLAGAGWFRIMTQITAPLARRSILGAAIVGYIFSLRDTGITMLVYPPGYETLPVRIFTLMANGSAELIAALCVLMMIATLVPPALFWVIALRMQEERFQ
ncbi:iron ABC transporter permease, partial [Myxococcota bacterium]|nr:iron ABC transporter permease [Myxococcota bacterium]